MSDLNLIHDTPVDEGASADIDKSRENCKQKKLYMEALDILSKNRITTAMLGDIGPDNVADMLNLATPHPDAEHRFITHNEGDIQTLVFLRPYGDAALIYIDFEIRDLSASDAVTIHPFSVGSLTSSGNQDGKDPYLIEEYDLSEIHEITLSADEPFTMGDLHRLWWYHNPNFHKIGALIVATQNWAFVSNEHIRD